MPLGLQNINHYLQVCPIERPTSTHAAKPSDANCALHMPEDQSASLNTFRWTLFLFLTHHQAGNCRASIIKSKIVLIVNMDKNRTPPPQDRAVIGKLMAAV